MKVQASIVIPYLNNNSNELSVLINKILLGKYFPNEIIIAYSGKKKLIIPTNIIKKFKQKKIDFKKIYKKKMYPGEGRNVGMEKSTNKIVGFLDLNTLPEEKWLYYGYKLIGKKYLIVWGRFFCQANTFVEKIIRASTLGSKDYEHIPGTILNKRIFKKVGKFIENIRAGEDGDWKNRAHLHKIKSKINNHFVHYYGLKNKNFLQIGKKWYIYYCHSKNLPHLYNQKNYYYWFLTILLILISYNWNSLIADWQTDSPKYIPNITKITLIFILSFYVFIRGIMLPLIKKEKILFIFPLNFLIISAFSLFLDTIKYSAFLNLRIKK